MSSGGQHAKEGQIKRTSIIMYDLVFTIMTDSNLGHQELQRYEDVSIHEILVTVEAAASAAPEMKWPLAGRFLGCEVGVDQASGF